MCVPKEQTQEKKSFVKAENLEIDPMDTTYAHIFFKKSFCTSRGIYQSKDWHSRRDEHSMERGHTVPGWTLVKPP